MCIHLYLLMYFCHFCTLDLYLNLIIFIYTFSHWGCKCSFLYPYDFSFFTLIGRRDIKLCSHWLKQRVWKNSGSVMQRE